MLRVFTIFYYGFRREDLELIIGPCELTSDMLKKQALERVKFFICVPSFSGDSSYPEAFGIEEFQGQVLMLQLSRRPPTVRVDELGHIRVAGLPRYVYMTEI